MKYNRHIAVLICIPAFLAGCAHITPPSSSASADPPPATQTPAPAQPTRASLDPAAVLTLEEAQSLALNRNPSLAALAGQSAIVRARLLQARQLPNPVAGVEFENLAGTGDFRAVRETETTVGLSQEILLGNKRGQSIALARSEQKIVDTLTEATRLEIAAATSRAFVHVLALQHQLEIEAEVAQIAEKMMETTRERVEAGRSVASDADKARASLIEAQIAQNQTRARLATARRHLANQWGELQPHFEKVAGELSVRDPAPPLAYSKESLAAHPRLLQWDAKIDSARSQLALERARAIPDVTVSGGYRRLNGPDEHAFVLGASVPWPLFNKNQGSIAEARRQLELDRQQKQNATLKLAADLEQALAAFENAQATVNSIENQLLPAANAAFNSIQNTFLAGRISLIDLLDAQRTLFAARKQLLEAIRAERLARVDIAELTGTLITQAPPITSP